jgi:uracil-DNA glycosylase
LVEELGLDEKGLLWAEAVFCERSPTTKGIPKQTFRDCRERFLREIIEVLVPPGKHIVCLGDEAFQSVEELVERHNRWKVIGVHHPTGRSRFANYFAREREKLTDRPLKGRVKLTDRPLKGRVKRKFRELEKQAAYLQPFKPE